MANLKIKDGEGVTKYVQTSGAGTDGDPFIKPVELKLSIPTGGILGMSSVNKFGANDSIADGTTEDIWDGGGTYSFPATALMTSISQTADQAAMQGKTMELQGLDASWGIVVQEAILDSDNTENVVTLDTPLMRVFRMKVLADVVSDSPIRCHNAAETVDYAVIGIGNNQTLMAIYTVPAGKTAYMTKYWSTSVEATGKEPKSTRFKLWMADRDNSYEFQLKHSVGIPKAGGMVQYEFNPYMKITEKTDIKLTASPVGEIGDVAAGFDLILIDD